MPYDNKQGGIEQALAQIGQQRRSANPYSPFQGQVPQQQLTRMAEGGAPAPQNNRGMMQPNTLPPMMQPPGMQQQAPSPLAQIGAPRPQMPQMSREERRMRLRERLNNPRFLAMLRQRRGL